MQGNQLEDKDAVDMSEGMWGNGTMEMVRVSINLFSNHGKRILKEDRRIQID